MLHYSSSRWTKTSSHPSSPPRSRCPWLQPARRTGSAGTTPPSLFLCGQTGTGWRAAGGPQPWRAALPFPPPPALQPRSPPQPPPRPESGRRGISCSRPSCEPNQAATETPGKRMNVEDLKKKCHCLLICIFCLLETLAGRNCGDSLPLRHWLDC